MQLTQDEALHLSPGTLLSMQRAHAAMSQASSSLTPLLLSHPSTLLTNPLLSMLRFSTDSSRG